MFPNSLSRIQLQVLLGGLLGDSSISPRGNGSCRLKINHSSPWKEYLLWKRDVLKEFFLQESPNVSRSSLSKHDSLSFHSIQHPIFKELFPLFYSSSKKERRRRIAWRTLESLDEFGVLIWYLDDGCLAIDKREPVKGKTIHLYSDAYSIEEHRMLKKWFWKRFKIEAMIQHDKTHNIFFLRFNRSETKALLTMFQQFSAVIPTCMLYKLDV